MVSHCASTLSHNKQHHQHYDRFQRSLFDLFDSPKRRAENTVTDPVPGSIRSVDPVRWAELCRHLGSLTPREFKKAEKRLYPDPDSLKNRLKCLFSFDQADCERLPLICIGKKL